MLGGGLGLAAAFYFDLSAEQAKLAVAGAAAFYGHAQRYDEPVRRPP